MAALKLRSVDNPGRIQDLRPNSGSFAIFAAIRRASPRAISIHSPKWGVLEGGLVIVCLSGNSHELF
jgi:hypothetical protein